MLSNRQFTTEAVQLRLDLAVLRIYQAYDAYGGGTTDSSLSNAWAALDALDDGAR